MIYVKEILAVQELAASSVPKHFEYIILDVCLGGNIHIQVMGIYRPPSAPFMALEELGKVLSSVASNELIILGVLNLDWLSDNSGSLKELCLELNLSQLINCFTRPNPKKPANSTLINLILTNKPFKYPYTGVFSQGISDHCPTACVRMVKGLKLKARSILKRNFKNFDEQAFLHDLFLADLDKICLLTDPELAWAEFSHIFNSLTDKRAPYKRFRVKDCFNPWFSNELSEVIHTRDLAWAKAGFTDSPIDSELLVVSIFDVRDSSL